MASTAFSSSLDGYFSIIAVVLDESFQRRLQNLGDPYSERSGHLQEDIPEAVTESAHYTYWMGLEVITSQRPLDEEPEVEFGKMFISDFLKGLVPEDIAKELEGSFKVDYATVVKNVYKGETPAAYLGSFAPWIMAKYDSSEYVKELADSNFRDFFERALTRYGTDSLPVGVVGGFGYANRNILMRLAEPYGIKFSKIIKAPVEGLVDFHSGRV